MTFCRYWRFDQIVVSPQAFFFLLIFAFFNFMVRPRVVALAVSRLRGIPQCFDSLYSNVNLVVPCQLLPLDVSLGHRSLPGRECKRKVGFISGR